MDYSARKITDVDIGTMALLRDGPPGLSGRVVFTLSAKDGSAEGPAVIVELVVDFAGDGSVRDGEHALLAAARGILARIAAADDQEFHQLLLESRQA